MFTTPHSLASAVGFGQVASTLYLLDNYTTPYGAYSVKRESTDYTGPLLRIERESDNVQIDIDSDDGNGITLSSAVSNPSSGSFTDLTDFAGVEDCKVVTWYDQSGNSLDLTLWGSGTWAQNPMLLVGGALITGNKLGTETYTFPMIRWPEYSNGTSVGRLRNNSYPNIDMNDLTIYTVFNRTDPGSNDRTIFSISPSGSWPSSGDSIEYKENRIYSALHTGSMTSFNYQNNKFKTICATLDVTPSVIRTFGDRVLMKTGGIDTPGTETGVVFGGNSKGLTNGFARIDAGSFFIFENKADAGREDIFDAYINPTWQLAPALADISDTSLPTNFNHEVEIYDILAGYVESDFTVPTSGSSITWDGTGTTAQKRDLHLELLLDGGNDRTERNEFSLSCEDKHYVKDDGGGFGWDGYGIAQGDNDTYGPWDYDGAYHYDMSLLAWWLYSFTGTGITNTTYGNAKLARRVFVSSYLAGLKHAEQQYTNPNATWGDRAAFLGGPLIDIATGFEAAEDAGLLTTTERDSCAELIRWFADRIAIRGVVGVNDNLDCKGVEGPALASRALDGNYASIKTRCIEAAKMVLFGKIDGSVTDLNEDGVFTLEGLIREGNGPAANYYGRSIDHIVRARVYTYGDTDWDFLDDVLERIAVFVKYTRMYQPEASTATTPTATVSGGGLIVGDSWSNRVRDAIQWQDTPWMNIAMSVLYTDGKIFACHHQSGNRRKIETDANLSSEITSLIASHDDYTQTIGNPQKYAVKSTWPKLLAYGSEITNWGSDYDTLVSGTDWQGPFHPDQTGNFSVVMPNATDAIDEATDPWSQIAQWWARRGDSSGRDFGYVIEGVWFSGTYSGYYSGTILAMGALDQGQVIASYREEKNYDYDWDEVEKRRVSRVWGYDGSDLAFDWSLCNGDTDRTANTARTLTWSATGNGTKTVLTPMENRGQEGSGFDYNLTCEIEFAGTASGCDITVTVADAGSHTCKELWYTLPMFITRGNSSVASYWPIGTLAGNHTYPDEYTIEYKSAAITSWTDCPDTRSEFTAQYIRIGIEWDGAGIKYSYLDLGADTTVRYKTPDGTGHGVNDWAQIGLFDINMHTNIGVDTAFPASTSQTVIWTVDDPS